MFFIINPNNVKIKLFIFYLVFGFISTANAEKNLTSTVTNFLNGIIQLPQVDVTDDGVDFICPGSSGSTSSLEKYTDFFSQVGTFIPMAGLLFSIVVYGAKSIFGIMTTCLIDDVVILVTSLGPIFWWYTFAKPIWFYGVVHEIQGDLNYDKGLINSIAIGVMFGSMVIILTFWAIIRFHFHQRRNELDNVSIWFKMLPGDLQLTNKEFFSAFKAMFIWGYFLHSVEVIVYSVLTYKYVFSTYFRQIEQLIIECTYRHGKKEKVYAEIKVKSINEIVYYYKDDKGDIRYRFGSTGGYFYVCEEKYHEKKVEDKKVEDKKVKDKKDKKRQGKNKILT
nr:10596_t:CDS:2 [Entrophospora candida]